MSHLSFSPSHWPALASAITSLALVPSFGLLDREMTKNRKFSRLKNPLVWSLDWAPASPLKQICRAGRTMYDVKEDNIVSHWNVRPSEVRGWSSQLSNYPQLCQTSVRHFVLRKLSDHLLWVRSPEKIFLQVLIFNNELQGRDASCELTLQDVSLDFLL